MADVILLNEMKTIHVYPEMTYLMQVNFRHVIWPEYSLDDVVVDIADYAVIEDDSDSEWL